MARHRYALCCALRHIYFNDFGLDKTFILSDLLALTSYYTDEDTPPEIIADHKKLHLWLTKLELMKKFEMRQGDAFIDGLMRELEDIGIEAMLMYVKNKAMQAGDFSMLYIRGDNDRW
jgi:hypothetical protein